MTGVAFELFYLKVKCLIPTRRGGCVASAPEIPRSLHVCCEILRDWPSGFWVSSVWKSGKGATTVIQQIEIAFYGSGISQNEERSHSPGKKMCTDSLEALGVPGDPQNASKLEGLGSGGLGGGRSMAFLSALSWALKELFPFSEVRSPVHSFCRQVGPNITKSFSKFWCRDGGWEWRWGHYPRIKGSWAFGLQASCPLCKT